MYCSQDRRNRRCFVITQAELEISSDFKELTLVRSFVRGISRSFSDRLLDEETVSQLELAVNEMVTNIIKHAYHGQLDRRIQMQIEVFSSHIFVRLYHWGEAFEPDKTAPQIFDSSRESGFGLYIVSHCVDAVSYSRDTHGKNCVILVKNLKKA